ncbi:MAG: hypothetical protein K2X91_08360 [Thermoleophilia bacterium]|nr:hypothetical protein [Thermoleophilia bacterium]
MRLGQGLRDLDRILRGEATRPSELGRGTIEAGIGGLAIVLAALGMAYGVCMGLFAVFRGSASGGLQVLASALKVPALFGLTLIVTFPSLYVFNALVGSRLTIGALLRLLLAALGVTLAVLASLGPIVAFFSASTTSYPFMQILNVAVFTISGLLGMAFLLQTLHRLSLEPPPPPAPPAALPPGAPGSAALPPPEGGELAESVPIRAATTPGARPPGALDRVDDRMLSRHVKAVFRCWIVLFGLVGAQMGWVLRPFIGDPALPFAWFRSKESNIFIAVLQAIGQFLDGR